MSVSASDTAAAVKLFSGAGHITTRKMTDGACLPAEAALDDSDRACDWAHQALNAARGT